MTQSGDSSGKSLYHFDVLKCVEYVLNGLDLVRINLYSSVRHKETYNFPKATL